MAKSASSLCDSCGSANVQIRWGSACYSPTDINIPEVEAGTLLLGNLIDKARDVPEFVCPTCEPRWLDVHQLVVRDCQLQLAMESAVNSHDFDKARLMRDLQYDLLPKLNRMVDDLLRGGPAHML
jgi:hypothetical protein